ncbi:MAG: hypothetical protein RL220_727, partial [Bacteroidota bacterium]
RTAWIVPTPGQREQEYLARYLQNQGWFHSVLQSRIQEIDVNSRLSNTLPPEFSNTDLAAIIAKRLASL